MFSSPTAARLQEIGPRFTLKLRWLRKGLPTVSAGDGMAPGGGDPEEGEADLEDDKDEEEAAMKDIGKPQKSAGGVQLAALDEEQEYEWKWKVSLATPLSDTWLTRISPRWRSPDVHSSSRYLSTAVYVSSSATSQLPCAFILFTS